VRVGVQLPEVEREVRWPEYVAMARAAEEVGFDSVWVGDHLLYRGPDRAPWDVWTLLAGLAVATERVTLGPLVACTAFAKPGVLARTAAAVDELSGGRLVLGLGAGWSEDEFRAFVNDRPEAFYDCLAFYPGGRRGLALSDPVDGKFRIAATDDFGRSWHVLPNGGMPDAVEGEFAFAASGTCLVTSGHDAWFASGGGASRVFRSHDGGLTWTVTSAPIPASEAGGVFSLAFRNPREGVMVGGDFLAPENGVDASGFSRDGGRTWLGGGDLSGYRSGVDWVSGARATLIAVGPTGSDVSFDGARSWKAFDSAPYDAVDCVRTTCWTSGPAGAVAVLAR
jgi:hypothetical protein